MNILLLTALALSLTFFPVHSRAQEGNSRADASSTISTDAPNLVDDETFAHFERVAPGIRPPKAIHAPDPKFPDLPPDAERHGIVVMLVGVNSKGHVEAVRVLRSDERAFEHSAIDTVKKWKFKPAEKNGQPVPVQLTVEMKFQK